MTTKRTCFLQTKHKVKEWQEKGIALHTESCFEWVLSRSVGDARCVPTPIY